MNEISLEEATALFDAGKRIATMAEDGVPLCWNNRTTTMEAISEFHELEGDQYVSYYRYFND